jgi:hypothetical protein
MRTTSRHTFRNTAGSAVRWIAGFDPFGGYAAGRYGR